MGNVSGAFISQWAKNINKVFDDAFESDKVTLIILDEFDGLITSGNDQVNNGINAVLKKQLDRLRGYTHVFVAAATNDIDDIDPIIRASKRFHIQICIGLPDDDTRKEILNDLIVQTQLAGVSIDAESSDSSQLFEALHRAETVSDLVSEITSKTEGYSPSDLRELVNKAKILARADAKSLGLTPGVLIQTNPHYLKTAMRNFRPTS